MKKLTPPIKWFGGKHYLAPKIVALFPRHLHYVEPFAGGLAVLLERDPNRNWAIDEDWRLKNGDKVPSSLQGCSELVNDINGELMNFWNVLRDYFDAFKRRCEATPFSREVYEHAQSERILNPSGLDDVVEKVNAAWAFFVACRQSRAGTFKGFTAITRSRTRRGINGNASEWLGAVDGLAAVHERLRPVVIENMDAVELIEREDAPLTLHYCDPPYVHSTRARGKDDYAYEMTDEQHTELLRTLSKIEGRFLLSGYRSTLYDSWATTHGWERHDFDLPNNAAGGKEKRRMTECVWCNF